MLSAAEMKPTDDDLDELAKNARGFVNGYLDGTSVDLIPQLLVMLKDPVSGAKTYDVVVLAVPFNTHVEKHAAMFSQGQRLYREQKLPIAITLISEAWQSKQENMLNADGSRKYLLPEDDPNRREVIIYHVLGIDGRGLYGDVGIARDRANLMTASGEWHNSLPMDRQRSPLLSSFYRGYFDKAITRLAVTEPSHA